MVRVVPTEIYEEKPIVYRVMAIDPLPGLMTFTSGQLLLPVSGGMICDLAGKPERSHRFLVYVEQPRWELATIVPVAAGWDGAGGLVLLASACAYDAEIRVATDGHGGGHLGIGAHLRGHWSDPVDHQIREVRLSPIQAGADGVQTTAQRLRRHLTEDLGVRPLAERAAADPVLRQLLGSMTIKLYHGMEWNGPMVEGMPRPPGGESFIPFMHFSEATDILRSLRGAGLETLHTLSTGWNARGHDGLYPTRFPVEERLGGEGALRELFRVSRELGYQPNVHDNFQMHAPHSPDWDPEVIIHTVEGEPLLRGSWAAGPEYGAWPDAFDWDKIRAHLRRVKDLGTVGMLHCDYMCAPLEVNHHPRHRGSRRIHAEGMIRLFQEVRAIHGSVCKEFGSMFGAAVCDGIDAGEPFWWHYPARKRSEWPVASLLDRHVCLWHLAMSGFTQSTANGGPTWSNALACLALGQRPRDQFSVRHGGVGGIPVFTSERVTALVTMQQFVFGRFGHLIGMPLQSCVGNLESAIRSVFADGTVVEVDVAASTLTVDGHTIERPAGLLA